MGAFGSEKGHFDKVCLRALLCISASKGPWGSDYNQTTSPLWRVNEVLGQRRTKETHIAPSWSFLFQLPSGKPLHQKNGLEYPPKFRKYLHHGESRWRNLNVSAILGGIPWKKNTILGVHWNQAEPFSGAKKRSPSAPWGSHLATNLQCFFALGQN